MTSTLIRDTSAEVSGERGGRETNEKVVNFFTQGTQGVSSIRVQKLIIPHVILRGDARDIFHLFPPSANISALQRFNFPFIELTFTGLYRRLHLVTPHVEGWRIFAELCEGFNFCLFAINALILGVNQGLSVLCIRDTLMGKYLSIAADRV